MKSYEQFIAEAPTEAQAAQMAPGMSPEKRRAALERNARNQARRETPATPKKQAALPPGKTGGAMEKRTSSELAKTQSKPSSIVKKPSNDVQNVKVKVDDMEGQRGNRPGSTKPAPKPAAPKQKKVPTGFEKGFKNQFKRKTAGLGKEGLGKKTANFVTDLPGKAANFMKSGLKTDVEVRPASKPGSLPSVKRRTKGLTS